jgi:DNA-binding response OmpR family regulator
MTKPFNPRELVARVKSILRRSTPARRASESAQISHGDLHVDSGRREARVGTLRQFRSVGIRPTGHRFEWCCLLND